MMHAAVYRGKSVVNVEEIPTPAIRPGEILIRVEACGICHTDLKKIEHNLLAPPRVYGHETAGVVAAVGAGVTQISAGRPGGRVSSYSLPAMFLLPPENYTRSARFIRKWESPRDSNRRAAALPSTCG